MIRKLKALGIALAAVFALGAVVASAASAQQAYLTSDGPVTLTGVETGEKMNRITAFGTFTECPGSTYTGHQWNVTPHESLEGHTTIVTISPNYTKCFSSALHFVTTIDMNECDYVFRIVETVGADTDGVIFSIVCPEKKHITITTKLFGETCKTTITEFGAGYFGISLTDTTNGSIDGVGSIAGIEAHREGGEFCPKATTNLAELSQDIAFSGRNKAGSATEIGISEEGETTAHV